MSRISWRTTVAHQSTEDIDATLKPVTTFRTGSSARLRRANPARPRPPRFAGGTPHCGRRFAPSSRTPPLRAPGLPGPGHNNEAGHPGRMPRLASCPGSPSQALATRRPARDRLPEAPAEPDSAGLGSQPRGLTSRTRIAAGHPPGGRLAVTAQTRVAANAMSPGHMARCTKSAVPAFTSQSAGGDSQATKAGGFATTEHGTGARQLDDKREGHS